MNKKVISIILVLIVLLGVGLFSFSFLFQEGIKPFKDVELEATYPIGEALNNEFIVLSKGLLSKDAEQTIWEINNIPIGSGKSVKIKDINYLTDGENSLIATSGDSVVAYKIIIDKNMSSTDKAQKAASLLDPVSNKFLKETQNFVDTDSDGVCDIDEIEKYKTNPNKDYSNLNGISDLAYAVSMENIVDDSGKLDIVFNNAKIVSNSDNIEDSLQLLLSSVHDKRMEDKLAVSVSGVKPNTTANLTIKDKNIKKYSEPKIAAFKSDGTVKVIEHSEYNKEEFEVSADIDSNGIYFLFDNVKYNPGDIEGLIHTEIAIVLDNSGSMYGLEAYKKQGIGKLPKPEEIGKDISFKRVSLMTDMIDALIKEEEQGNGNYKYSVSSFTADYYLMNGIDNAERSKKAVDSIKTANQKFTGTKIEKAIDYSIKTFTKGLLGNRVVICLTDGESTSGGLFDFDFDQMSAEANIGYDLKKQGIDLILIGLGNDVNREKLQKLANVSGGILLYGDDADALQTLLDRIVKKVKVGSVEDIKFNTAEEDVIEGKATIIADSGFEAAVDGFNFKNFGVVGSEGGNCYGFSVTSKMIYEGYNESNQFWKLGETKVHDNLTGVLMSVGGMDKTIPNARLTESALSKLKKGQVYKANIDTTKIFTLDGIQMDRVYKDGDYLYTEDARKTILENGYDLVTLESYNKKLEKYDVKNLETREYNPHSPNAGKQDPDGNSIIRLINRGQLSQSEGLIASIQTKERAEIDFEDTLAPVIRTINSGKPSMISMSCSLGGHSVLATKVSQDNKNPCTYYIYIYDSNEPGKNMIGELKLKNITRNGKLSSKYYFNYFGAGLNFNTLGYRADVTVYEGNTTESDYSPSGKVNTNMDKVFYKSTQK